MPKHVAATIRTPPPFDPTAAIIRPCHLRAATGLSPTTVWRLRRAGQFPPAIQVGRARDWLAAGRHRGVAYGTGEGVLTHA